jgi:glycosyltransferase involved in cell wall biosynthesis
MKIVHCMRSPLGGLFRHVVDLSKAQCEAGHDVGIIADSLTGGERADAAFAALGSSLALGVHRVPMSREIGIADFRAFAATRAITLRSRAQILHGHGAKGGAFARLAARSLRGRGHDVQAFYTPHGGSLHYEPGTLKGRIYLGLERRLSPLTDGLIFESAYSSSQFAQKVGAPGCPCRVIPNGLAPEEFTPVDPDAEAADFLFVGELRRLKGVDVLLNAMAIARSSHACRLIIVGDGPNRSDFEEQTRTLGLDSAVSFVGALPARKAFELGRCLVVPSRAESFPYIVLEGAAAGLPMLLTEVGGIPEIVKGTSVTLLPPGEADALAPGMKRFLSQRETFRAEAVSLRDAVRERCSIKTMAETVMDFYRVAPAAAAAAGPPRQALQPGM